MAPHTQPPCGETARSGGDWGKLGNTGLLEGAALPPCQLVSAVGKPGLGVPQSFDL